MYCLHDNCIKETEIFNTIEDKNNRYIYFHYEDLLQFFKAVYWYYNTQINTLESYIYYSLIKRARLYLNENKDNYGYSKIISFIKNQMPTEYYKLICDIVGIKDSGFGKEKLKITENMVSKWIINKDLYSDPRGPKPPYNFTYKNFRDWELNLAYYNPYFIYDYVYIGKKSYRRKLFTTIEHIYLYSYSLQKWRIKQIKKSCFDSIRGPIAKIDFRYFK